MKTKLIVLSLLAICLGNAPLALAQNTVISYQGRVLDNGTNFNGIGQFKFALVTSTNFNRQATATATISGGFVTIYTVTFGGSGYTVAPAVTISGGGGSGASATAHLTGGAVTSITVNNPGNGSYTTAPTVSIAPPPANIAYTTYWSNDGTSSAGSEPAAAVGVSVASGLFTVGLGDTALANMAGINASLFLQPNLQLRIWFNDGLSGFAALSPVQSLTPTPYAAFANRATSAATATNATSAITATTANSFTGSLSGDVTGTQGATVVASVGGQSAADVANGVVAAYSATSANTANRIVKRDASGSFFAASITLANNLNLPASTASSGAIYSGGGSFIHASGTRSIFAGSAAGNFATSGMDNAGFGYYALGGVTSGYWNVGVGSQALGYNTGGIANTAVGFLALGNLSTGQNNIALGKDAGASITSGNNNIFIGNNGSDGDSSVIRIGTPGVHQSASIAGIYNHAAATGVPVYVGASGQLGTVTSSAKFKQDIQDMGDASDALLALKPVTFRYKPGIDPGGTPQFGLIAEDVDKVAPGLVVRDEEHGIYTVRYQAVDAMLLNEFLKDHRKVEAQRTEIETLKARLERLEQLLNARNGGGK